MKRLGLYEVVFKVDDEVKKVNYFCKEKRDSFDNLCCAMEAIVKAGYGTHYPDTTFCKLNENVKIIERSYRR